MPRPVSRLTWDNAVIVSQKTADDLNVTDEDQVAIDYNGHTVWGAIWRIPGQPDGSIGLSMGYGRTRSGRAGNGAGFDVYPLRPASNPYFGTGASVRKLGKKFRLAAVQHHFAMEDREPVHAGTLEEFQKDPYFSQKHSELPPKGLTIFPETFKYEGYAWGMAIDLTSCVGMQRLRGGLPGGKQYRGGGQGAGAQYARNALDPHRPLLQGRAGRAGYVLPAGGVRAVRRRALRNGLPGGGDRNTTPKA